MNTEDQLAANKALILRIYQHGYDEGDATVFDDAYTPDFVHHSKTVHDFSPGGEGEKESMGRFRRALPDVRFTVLDQVAERDLVATRLRIVGTPVEDFGGIHAGVGVFDVHALALFRVRGGRVAEEWFFVDGGD
jgi:predicted ester cyclase